MELINQYLSGTFVPFALVFCSFFFFVRLRGRPMRNLFTIIKSLFIKKEGSGVSPIRAVIFALAGTLGVGNIVGVASAIALGGAGAVFWMWISAFFAMILNALIALNRMITIISKAYASAKRIDYVFDLGKDLRKGNFTGTSKSYIEFRNVNFSYLGKHNNLENINFKLNKKIITGQKCL